MKYDEIEKAISGAIQRSVYGYTMNSWYNYWSTILREEIFIGGHTNEFVY